VSASEEELMIDPIESTEVVETEVVAVDTTAVETDVVDTDVVETEVVEVVPVVAAPAAPTPAATPTPKGRAGKAGKPGHLAQTVGRRKEAIVRVRLMPGTGVFTLNGRTLEGYFPNKVHQQLVREPLVITERHETYDVIANLRGGGITGQAGALRLAVARALIEVDVDDRPALKKAGFLTRDARVTESKKYGLKKARKAPQYSKR
jgi:small subunit ribosomal protein S9